MYSIAVAAQSYSQIAGILAAFSFAVVVWLVERLHDPEGSDPQVRRHTVRALVLLIMTFVANVLTAFMWGGISGEADLTTHRPGILSYLTGLNFGLAVPVMVQSTIFVVTSARLKSAVKICRRICFVAVLLSFGQQWASTLGLVNTQWPSSSSIADHWGLFLVCLPATGLMVLAGAYASRYSSEDRFGVFSDRSFNWFISLWLAGSVAVAVGFGVIRSLSTSEALLPLWAIGVANVVWSALLAWALSFLPVLARENGA